MVTISESLVGIELVPLISRCAAGSEQQNVLQWKRTQKLLKDQSLKMGKQYDSPESKSHIQPFIDSFRLQDSLKEFVSRKESSANSSRGLQPGEPTNPSFMLTAVG